MTSEIRCSIKTCNFINIIDWEYFPMPTLPTLKKQWFDAIGTHNLDLTKDIHICSLHFRKTSFILKNNQIALVPGTVPSINLPDDWKLPQKRKETNVPSTPTTHTETIDAVQKKPRITLSNAEITSKNNMLPSTSSKINVQQVVVVVPELKQPAKPITSSKIIGQKVADVPDLKLLPNPASLVSDGLTGKLIKPTDGASTPSTLSTAPRATKPIIITSVRSLSTVAAKLLLKNNSTEMSAKQYDALKFQEKKNQSGKQDAPKSSFVPDTNKPVILAPLTTGKVLIMQPVAGTAQNKAPPVAITNPQSKLHEALTCTSKRITSQIEAPKPGSSAAADVKNVNISIAPAKTVRPVVEEVLLHPDHPDAMHLSNEKRMELRKNLYEAEEAKYRAKLSAMQSCSKPIEEPKSIEPAKVLFKYPRILPKPKLSDKLKADLSQMLGVKLMTSTVKPLQPKLNQMQQQQPKLNQMQQQQPKLNQIQQQQPKLNQIQQQQPKLNQMQQQQPKLNQMQQQQPKLNQIQQQQPKLRLNPIDGNQSIIRQQQLTLEKLDIENTKNRHFRQIFSNKFNIAERQVKSLKTQLTRKDRQLRRLSQKLQQLKEKKQIEEKVLYKYNRWGQLSKMFFHRRMAKQTRSNK